MIDKIKLILKRGAFHKTYRLLKACWYALLYPQYVYEAYVAKFMSRYFFFLYAPLIFLCRRKGIRFLVNVAPSVGHTTFELDHFFRKLYLEELEPSNKYVLIVKGNYIFRDFLKLYRKRFDFAIASTFLYHLLLPFLMRDVGLTIDSGVSRLKWQFHAPDESRGVVIRGKPFLFQLLPKFGVSQMQQAYARWKRCPEYFPLALSQSCSEPLLKKTGLLGKKLALIHIKANVMNATAAHTDPASYLPALKHLADLGYKLVFVGREAMPDAFKKFDFFNYSQSYYTSFKNDILLFQACELAIVGGSGIAYLAECLDKPSLYLNSWHSGLAPFSRKSIFLPARVKKKNGPFLSFSAQYDLYLQTTSMDELFPCENYEAVNAAPDEILEGLKELIALRASTPLTELQKRYMTIDRGKGMLPYSLTRVGQYFLEQHQDLI